MRMTAIVYPVHCACGVIDRGPMHGLGDLVERCLGLMGITSQRVHYLTCRRLAPVLLWAGCSTAIAAYWCRPCHCNSRRRWLNQLLPFNRSWRLVLRSPARDEHAPCRPCTAGDIRRRR